MIGYLKYPIFILKTYKNAKDIRRNAKRVK